MPGGGKVTEQEYLEKAKKCAALGDLAESMRAYRAAAEEWNSADAQYELGDCYYFGVGVEQNLEEAVKWYTKSAEQGNASAQTNLGDAYTFGEGVDADRAEAVRWYLKAAKQGDARAQYALGDCYYFGGGIEQNLEEAVKWYTESAKQVTPISGTTAHLLLHSFLLHRRKSRHFRGQIVHWHRPALQLYNTTLPPQPRFFRFLFLF